MIVVNSHSDSVCLCLLEKVSHKVQRIKTDATFTNCNFTEIIF